MTHVFEGAAIAGPIRKAPSRHRVVIEGPDGQHHGSGHIIASADASQVRPQDCAPVMRRLLFGRRG